MSTNDQIEPMVNVKECILFIRGCQVILDSDLAKMYHVETRVLNQAVTRNKERFPSDFMFQLTEEEWNDLKSQTVTSSWGGRRKLPFVFTEQGIASLSGVLKGEVAVGVNIAIMRAFVQMRKTLLNNAGILQRLDSVEQKMLVNEKRLEQVFKAIDDKSLSPKQGIFFDGQIFDAYVFVSDLIKQAEKSIVLIDNYVDETVFTLLDKRSESVRACIYTKVCKKLTLDLVKHNQQYREIELKNLTRSHDRFLILDDKTVYHFGASLKDLGKKWFAFSRMEIDAQEILQKINES